MEIATVAPIPFEVSGAELNRRPHEVFRHYRPLTPVIKRENTGYIVIRAVDVTRLLCDVRLQMPSAERVQPGIEVDGTLHEFFTYSMLLSNPPDHRRRRMPLARAFGFEFVTQLRSHMRSVAHELIDQVYERGGMDFVEHYCSSLPARVLCRILGIPAADAARFRGWATTMARATSSRLTRENLAAVQDAASQLTVYVAALLRDREIAPRGDFLSRFVSDIGNTLSATEAIHQIVTVILAGSDTTRTGMAMVVALLLQHPEQWEAIRLNPALVPGAVLEALRFETPAASVPRVTLEDIDISPWVIPRDQLITLSILSSLRDPALYTEPDRFDITRTDHPHNRLIFGAGSHRCLGEIVARAELEEGLSVLIERLPNLRITGTGPRLFGSGGIREISDMSVVWR